MGRTDVYPYSATVGALMSSVDKWTVIPMGARTQEFNCLASRIAANGVTVLSNRVERVTASRPFRRYEVAYMAIDDDAINSMGDSLLESYTFEPCSSMRCRCNT